MRVCAMQFVYINSFIKPEEDEYIADLFQVRLISY